METQTMTMTMPKNVKFENLENPNPEINDSFLYLFRNTVKNINYIGIHKGEPLDGYWNSSTSEEFKSDLLKEKNDFLYKILDYGTFEEMQTLEHKKLSDVDAKNNPNWYNKTNGASSKSVTILPEDLEDIAQFVDSIRSGEDLPYGLVKTPNVKIEDIMSYKRHQNREQDYNPAHKLDLQQKFDDRGGDTSGYYAVVLEDVFWMGEHYDHLKIDGNHSARACQDSKMAEFLDVIYVPKQVHEKLFSTDNHLNLGASLFNKQVEQKTLNTTIEDAVKQVVMMLNDGYTTKNAVVNKFLELHRFTSSQCRSIRKQANDTYKLNTSHIHQNWIQWGMEPYKSKLDTRLKNLNAKDNVYACAKSTKSLSYWHELREIAMINENASDKEKIKFVQIFLHHTSSKNKKLHEPNRAKDENAIKFLLAKHDIEVNIEYLQETKDI